MIDPEAEKLIPFTKVPDLEWLPTRRNGTRLAVSTVHRWKDDGLEYLAIGGVFVTSKEALLRYFNRDNVPANPATPRQMSVAHGRAMKALAAAGI